MRSSTNSQNAGFLIAGLISLFCFPFQALQAQCPNPIIVGIKVEEPDCHGDANGTVSGKITGGIPPYTVILNGKVDMTTTVNAVGGNYYFSGLSSGNYTIRVRDAHYANGSACSSINKSFNVSEPPKLVMEVHGDSIDCGDKSDGHVTGKVSGGTPPYTVILNGASNAVKNVGNSGGSFNFSGLSSGNYSITVIDAKYVSSGKGAGCTANGAAVIATKATIETTVNKQICEGQSYKLGTQTLTTTGIYQEVFTSSSGCDSTVTLHLNVVPGPNTILNVTICQGENYILGPRILSTSGTYKQTFFSNNSCDSTILLYLTVVPELKTTVSATICQGGSYSFGTRTLTTKGTYRETFTSSSGCDSTVTLNLSVLPELNTTANATICQGGSYLLGTQTLTNTGTYRETFTSSSGCDSIVTLNLQMSDGMVETINAGICEGQAYHFGAQELTVSGVYRDTILTGEGCDKVTILTLTVKPAPEVTILAKESPLCFGDTLNLTAVIEGTEPFRNSWIGPNGASIIPHDPFKLVLPDLGQNDSGKYSLSVIDGKGCKSSSSIFIQVNQPFELKTTPEMDTLCVRNTIPISVEISGGTPDYEIQWYDKVTGGGVPFGATATVFVSPNIGYNSYLVKVSDAGGCTLIDTSTITIIPIDAMITPMDTIICDGTEELILTVKNNDPRQTLTYEWQPQNAVITDPTGPEVMVDLNTATEFSVLVTSQDGCDETLTSNISTDACSSLDILADPPKITPGEEAILTITGCNDCEFLWSSGQTGSTITVNPQFTTTYSVTVTTTEDCVCTDLTQTVEVTNCLIDPNSFFVPSAFTPNGDQINDELCIRSPLETAPDDVDILLIIYNRWGQELFRGTSFGDCWDGTYKGAPVAPDVYGYYLKVMCEAESFVKNGDVSIIR